MASIWRRRRAKQDVWILDYRDPAGRRHRLTAPTKGAAENLFAERVRDRQHPTLLSPDREITLAEYASRWLEVIASEISPRTLQATSSNSGSMSSRRSGACALESSPA